jgi:hypothetical protein
LLGDRHLDLVGDHGDAEQAVHVARERQPPRVVERVLREDASVHLLAEREELRVLLDLRVAELLLVAVAGDVVVDLGQRERERCELLGRAVPVRREQQALRIGKVERAVSLRNRGGRAFEQRVVVHRAPK